MLVADNNSGAAKILAARFPDAGNLGDFTALPAAFWQGLARDDGPEILTAGFPCQDVSAAGVKRGLRAGTRTGIWSHIAVITGIIKPRLVILENVRGLLYAGADSNVEPCPGCLGVDADQHHLRALGAVLGDLADIGYDAEWVTVPATAAGAPHKRERVFVVAYPAHSSWHGRLDGVSSSEAGEWRAFEGDAGGSDLDAADPEREGLEGFPGEGLAGAWRPSGQPAGGDWGPYAGAITRWEEILGRPAPRPVESGRSGDRLSPLFVEWMMGLPEGWVTAVPGLTRQQQLHALGNGVVVQQAILALRMLLEGS